MKEHHSFVVVAEDQRFSRWLEDVLQDYGEIIVLDHFSLDRMLQLVDMTGSQVALLGLTRERLHEQRMFLEGLVAAKPLLPVIALAESQDQNLLLTAMRSGAKDFITPEQSHDEVVNAVRQVLSRQHVQAGSRHDRQGWLASIVSARPGSEAPMFALHLALGLQMRPGNKVLLLDLGMPVADTLLFLGVKPTYTFIDAIRSLRRLDSTLIETAFGKHSSGLHMLAMPEEYNLSFHDITSVDVYVLLGSLRRFFTHIVINLGGVPASDFLFLPLGQSDRILLLAEQGLASIKHNMSLLEKLREHKIGPTNMGVVIDRYLPKMPPDSNNIAKGMKLPVLATLPSSGMARLTVMNSGQSMYQTAPRDPYVQAIRNLVKELSEVRENDGKHKPGRLARIFGFGRSQANS